MGRKIWIRRVVDLEWKLMFVGFESIVLPVFVEDVQDGNQYALNLLWLPTFLFSERRIFLPIVQLERFWLQVMIFPSAVCN